MARRKRIDLSAFDNKLMDGLSFCRRVYALFDQITTDTGGVARLRMLASKTEKRLSEELVPMAHYIQARYREGYRLKVRWFAGSQPRDGEILCSGVLIEQLGRPKKLLVEITSAMHENDYLVREHVNAGNVSFGPKGMARDKATGKTTSTAYVNEGADISFDLAGQITDALKKKGAKKYPANTVLIINCIANTLIDEPEWQEAIEIVRKANVHGAFREVVLIDRRLSRVTTL